MKTPRLEIRTSRHVADKDGRAWLTFTPVFLPDVTAGGELSFACYQRPEDEPASHEEAKQSALDNARRCLALFSAALPPPNQSASDLGAAPMEMALREIDRITCNCPLMSLEAQRDFEQRPEAREYKVKLARIVIDIRGIARAAHLAAHQEPPRDFSAAALRC